MDFKKISCEDFVEKLGSKSPTPGGGGASALVGAVGIALGNMVASLTIGKKKYANVEEDMKRLKLQAENLQRELLTLIEEDGLAFEPLSKAYGLPVGTEEEREMKSVIMEEALKKAAEVPLEIMRKSCEAIDLQCEFAEKGSRLAISDAGVGVIFCKAALMGSSLNVFINTAAMTDEVYKLEINRKAEGMLEKYQPIADKIYEKVKDQLK